MGPEASIVTSQSSNFCASSESWAGSLFIAREFWGEAVRAVAVNHLPGFHWTLSVALRFKGLAGLEFKVGLFRNIASLFIPPSPPKVGPFCLSRDVIQSGGVVTPSRNISDLGGAQAEVFIYKTTESLL